MGLSSSLHVAVAPSWRAALHLVASVRLLLLSDILLVPVFSEYFAGVNGSAGKVGVNKER